MEGKKILKKKIIVTGGGSGGHISTAKAIIDKLRERYEINDNNFLYVGSDLGMEREKPGSSLEMKVFKNETFSKKYIRGGKLQRSLSLNGIFLLFRTILGFWDSFQILRKFKPDIIISTGGFVSVPVCLVGKMLKAKIYLHEQTAAVGLSNKIVSKYAESIFITFPISAKYFPNKKTIHTGNLVRDEIFEKYGTGPVADAVKKMLELQEEYPIIYISGGSLGSHVINETVKDSLLRLLQDYQIIIQTGDSKITNDYQLLQLEREKLSEDLKKRLCVTKYIGNEEIGTVLNNIDLFVGRSGANTVYEMGVLQIPSIFIPIPWVTHNEQMRNAKILEEVGLAKIIKEGELTPEKLQITITLFLKKVKDIDQKKLKDTFILGAADKIIDSIDLT